MNEPIAAELKQRAVRNNAEWCDAVCRAHGRPGEFRAGMWTNRHGVPRFYPNAVTLSDGPVDAQTAAVDALRAAGIPGECGVKDSFATLDLRSRGFHVLFEAQWLAAAPTSVAMDAGWKRITSSDGLARWEAAWGGAAAAGLPRVFMPPLLEDDGCAILAAHVGSTLVAGVIAFRAAGVVGLSNFFDTQAAGARRASGVASAAAVFPGLPLVGYESGADLHAAEALGFDAIGRVRVWVRAETR